MEREQRFSRIAGLPFETIGADGKGTQSRSFGASLRDILKHRHILGLFVRRDLKSRYKDSVLGFAWTLIRPITQLAIYWVVVGKFLGAERGIPLFAIYIFTGLTAFGLFQEIVTSSTNSIVSNSGLVKKVYVPRELFPLAATGTAIFNFAIQLMILLAACLVFGNVSVSWDILYFFPATIILLLFGTGLGLLLSAWNVYLRDVAYLVEVLMMIMLWASPILYSWEMVQSVLAKIGAPWLLEIYLNNPITLAILGYQRAIWGTAMHGLNSPSNMPLRMLIAVAVGLAFIYLAQRVFSRLQGNFAQEL